MNIGFCGAGNAGVSLCKYFKENGLNISGFYSRTLDSAKLGASICNTKVFLDIEDLVHSSDIIFITTNDDQINKAYQSLKNSTIRDKIIIHISGSLSSNVFSNARELGAYSYSLHPIYPFSNKETSYKNLDHAVFSLEGDPDKLDLVRELIESLGNKVVLLTGDKKSYHLACVLSANLSLALTSIATNYLKKVGFNEEDAVKALIPLLESNIENIKNSSLSESLTGPVVRGDTTTINGHLSVLEEEDKAVYTELSKELLRLSVNRFGENENYKNLEEILGGNL